MMNSNSVLLVHPPYSTYQKYLHSDFQEPLGVLFLAGYLRQKGINVDVIDFFNDNVFQCGEYYWQGLSEQQIEDEFRKRQPSVIGISSMFSIHCHAVHRVAAAAKKAVPSALVVVGGTHASSFPKVLASDKNIDIVVVGEGEQTLLEIIERHSYGEALEGIAGTAYFNKDGIYCQNPPRDFLDFSTHPGPARDILDIDRYISSEYSKKHGFKPRRLPIVTSRGCPYKCIFCSIHSVWRHSYHRRNPEVVLDEIEWLVTEHGVEEIMFWDDNIAANSKHFNAILDGIIGRRLPIRWCTPNGIAIWLLDEELIDKCRRAGCYKLTFGIETGSEKTQQFIRKNQINFERAKQLILYCNSIGLWTMSPFIIGFPFERREDIMATIDYAIDCGVDVASFFIAVPYPGCEMYDIYKENGLLPEAVERTEPDKWIGNVMKSKINTCYLSSEDILDLHALAERKFRSHRRKKFLNPAYLASKIRSWDDVKFMARMLPQGIRQYLLLKQ